MALPTQGYGPGWRAADPRAFVTPSKKSGIDEFFESLNTQDGLFSPFNDKTSPSKRRKSPGHEVVSRVNLLYFQNQEALVDAIAHFRLQSPDLRTNDDRLNCLLERLDIAARSCRLLRTPGSRDQGPRNQWPPRSIQPSHEEHRRTYSAPPSPTLSVRHAPKSSFAEAEKIELPPTMSRYGARPESNLSNASFATANTSFSNDGGLNTSFWSNAPNDSQDPPSPATSVGSFVLLDDMDAKSSQAYGSFPYSQINELDQSRSSEDPQRSNSSFNQELKSSATSESCTESAQAVISVHQPVPAPSLAKQYVMEPPGNLLPHTKTTFADSITPTKTRSADVTTPAKTTFARPPAPPDAARELPVPEHHRVKRITDDGLSCTPLPAWLLKLPLNLRAECLRFCEVTKLTPADLQEQWAEPRTAGSLYQLAEKLRLAFHRGADTDSNTDIALFTEFQWSNSSSAEVPVIQLRMLPPRENESNAYQRKFEARRFLYADLPTLTKVPECMDLGGQGRCIENRVKQLLQQELAYLGCRWRCFLVRPKKKGRRFGRESGAKKLAAFQLHFFAVTGQEHDKFHPINIVDVVDWAVPLRENLNQPHCKAYARLDLQASTTEPAFRFTPDEIEYSAPDKVAENVPSDTRFNDPDLDHLDHFEEGEDVVMNDGQCYIDPWVVGQIQAQKDLLFAPSTIQARLFGGKGMWAVRPGPVPVEKPRGHLIGISKSQIKAKQKAINFTKDFDLESLTFNILDVTSNARPSVLYPDFLPILLDRGVSEEKIKGMVKLQVKREVGKFLEALECRHKVRQWIHLVNRIREERDRETGIETLADFPVSRTERVIRMLESGFEPLENRYLANEVLELAKKYFEFASKVFRIQIPQSTMVRGIADPCNCLEPGEVHLNFSSCFEDADAGLRWPALHGIDVLVARNPALRRSDMQKRRAVFMPQLAHLTDNIVFSAKGKRPDASLLQGGDYDGDMYAVYWQPEMVEGFKNATAPVESHLPAPESLGIEVDKEKLGDLLGIKEDHALPIEEHNVLKWIWKNIETRLTGTLLGVVTLAHGKVVYHEGDLNSEKAEALVDLHDHLVDADKRGFRFTNDDWLRFKAQNKILDYAVPAYRSLLQDDDDDLAQGKNTIKALPKRENIIDFIHFFIVQKEIDKGLKSAEAALAEASIHDTHLVKLIDDVSQLAIHDSAIRVELNVLTQRVSQLATEWNAWTSRRAESRHKRVALKDDLDWDEMVVRVLLKYQEISPQDITHPRIDEWVQRIGNAPTKWELLKASALAKLHPGKIQLIYKIAGDELCRLKARESSERTRPVELMMDAYLDLKLKKAKRKRRELEAVDEFDEEYGYDAEAFDALLGAEADQTKELET